MRNSIRTFITVLCLSLTSGAFAQSQNRTAVADSISVMRTVEGFRKAFINLDWENFRQYFAEDITAFFPPSAKFPGRTNNKAELEAVFQSFFASLRQQKSAPPYLQIDPKDARVQLEGNIAIVSFWLDDSGVLGRRTLIWRKLGDKWLMIHMHGSGIPVSK